MPDVEVRKTRHHDVRMVGLSSWTAKPSRIMARQGVRMKNLSQMKAARSSVRKHRGYTS